MDEQMRKNQNTSMNDQFSFSDVCYFRNDLKFFSEPESLMLLKKSVLPQLASNNEIVVWMPFAETGEDAYTLSILMSEFSQAQPFKILAGEDKEHKLIKALQGKYQKDDVLRARRTYFFSGGKNDLLDYFVFDGEEAIVKSELRKTVHFAPNEEINPNNTHLIYLPNLLSKMEVEAQRKLLRFLKDNLCENGFLILGNYDTLNFSESFDGLERVDSDVNIWRKIF